MNIFAIMEGQHISEVIAGMNLAEAEELLTRLGADSGYARKVLHQVYRRGNSSFMEADNLPRRVREILTAGVESGLSSPVELLHSADGSVKYLFTTPGGLLHETVWLPEGKRSTVCVSVQSGCRMGCRFCATGMNGWRGNLTAGEILNQVISLPHEVTHIVMMGMGEPGDNIEEVIRAYQALVADWGLAAGRSRVTVSTVGVTPGVKRLLEETECNITLSLHSPFSAERRGVIPAEALWPFADTLKMLKEYDNRRRRRFTVAYVMAEGVNDSPEHLQELKQLLAGTGIRVNLLPYHPAVDEKVRSSGEEKMMLFKHELVTSGIGASVRRSRGADIAAACGMLAGSSTANPLG